MKTRSARSRVCTLIAALSLIGMTAVTGCASKQVTGLSTLTPDGSVPIRTEIKDFILGPGDELSISVWRFNDLNQVALVSKGGDIQMLPVGEVHVAGLNAYQVRDVLAERLSDYIVNPQVSVSVKSLKSQKIFVLGEVYRPGVFPIEANFSALNAIAEAGGFTPDADQAAVLLVRKGQDSQTVVYPLNLEQTLTKGDLTYNPPLEAGDVLYVAPTTMVDLARFSARLTQILSPLIALEAAFTGFEDAAFKWPFAQSALQGKISGTGQNLTNSTTTIILQPPH